MRLRQILKGLPLVEAGPALKNQVHYIRFRHAFRSPCLSSDELGVQCVRKPRYDLVLHIKQVGDGFVEALGP